MTTVTITWTRCRTYKDAIDALECVYLHEWDGKPYYWGICDRSVFGGNSRTISGQRRQPRYGSSYRHWIDGCLEHGAGLYIGKCEAADGFHLQNVEATLIAEFPSTKNREPGRKVYDIVHVGDIPSSCLRHHQ